MKVSHHDITAEQARTLLKAQDPTTLEEWNVNTTRPHLSHIIVAEGSGWSGRWDGSTGTLLLWGDIFN